MSLTTKVSIPAGINAGVSNAKQSTMINLLGKSRNSFDEMCRAATNNPVKSLLVTEDVGPFKVTGLKPAVDSLREILKEIAVAETAAFNALSSAGMYCGRYVRGSQTSISNHAWGTAIDLYVNAKLDARGDGKVFQGLVDIFPIFNKHKWFWGAGFRTEDAMHFEASDELVREWAQQGKLSSVSTADESLTIGDRGSDVIKLQEALNRHGFLLKVDGKFGINTEEVVIDFQEANGLRADGIVGKKTKAKL